MIPLEAFVFVDALRCRSVKLRLGAGPRAVVGIPLICFISMPTEASLFGGGTSEDLRGNEGGNLFCSLEPSDDHLCRSGIGGGIASILR